MSPNPPVAVLRTPRLRLEPYRPGDREAFCALVLDPQIMAHVDGPADRDAALALFARLCDGSGEPVCKAWAVREDDAYLGHVFLAWIDDDPEIGFVFTRPSWGRGLATEAATAVLEFARRRLGLRRITASVDTEHAPSRRVLEKIGLQLVGEERDADGTYLRYAWQADPCP